MLPLLIEGSLAVGSGLVAMAWLRVRGYRSVEIAESPDDGFSLERYEPMTRLLSQRDLDFLRSKPGVSKQAVKRFRQQRLRVFRSYLNELASDFLRLHRRARVLITEAPAEYSELVGVLMRQEVRFWTALAGVEARLALHQVGIGTVDIRALLRPVEAIASAMPVREAGLVA
jgi:hypothetical protein